MLSESRYEILGTEDLKVFLKLNNTHTHVLSSVLAAFVRKEQAAPKEEAFKVFKVWRFDC